MNGHLHHNLTSCVLHKGYHSASFPVLQGTRQGGVISPFLYLCFIDDLLNEICECGAGFKIDGVCYTAPTACDDMLLLALSKCGLDILMNICFRNSSLWRFSHSTIKSFVVVFNETKSSYRKHKRKWHLGPNEIAEQVNYKHLGVNCNKYLDISINIKDIADKLKSTFMSIVNCGLFNDLNPLTCKSIYKSVVLPKALYGCESLSHLSHSNILKLERAHRFCVKYIQGLNTRTRTDIALSLMGIHAIESEIDFMKLNLFGQFCRSNVQCWVKTLFMQRLLSYQSNSDKQIGFIPDIVRLLSKYSLVHVYDQFIQHTNFPSKNLWKREVRSRIQSNAIALWENRTSTAEFSDFKCLHRVYEPHWLWQFAKNNPQVLHCCRSVIQMIAGVPNESLGPRLCSVCNAAYANLVEHCIHDCVGLLFERRRLWFELSCIDVNVNVVLHNLDKCSLTIALLGGDIVQLYDLLGDRLCIFRKVCISNLDAMWSRMYNRWPVH